MVFKNWRSTSLARLIQQRVPSGNDALWPRTGMFLLEEEVETATPATSGAS